MPLYKVDHLGRIYEASPIRDDGMGIARRPKFADETNVALSERDPVAEKVRLQEKLKMQKHQELRQLHKERKQRKKEHVERVFQNKKLHHERKLEKAQSAINNQRANRFVNAVKQSMLGYEYDSLIGDPLAGFEDAVPILDSGFGGGIKIGKPKIKISVPSVKKVISTAAKIATAPVAVTAHIVKQAGGSKLEKVVQKATGVSIMQAARGGDATVAQIGKAASVVASAPAQAVKKTISAVGGHKLENFLDRTTGGTYSQAIKVGELPGKALAGKAITKEDQEAVKGLAIKAAVVAATVYGAGSVSGAVSNMVQQQASKELAKKVGGSAGSIIAGAGALAAGDVAGAAKTVAQKEVERAAVTEASKKLGKEAGSILAIGTSAATGGTEAALQTTKDIGKQKAIGEVAKKTGLPVGVIASLQSGKVPSPSEIKSSMEKELTAAPDKLQSELAKLPDQIKKAPAGVKKVLEQKQSMIKEELANRDAKVLELTKKHVEDIKNADAKIVESVKKTDAQKLIVESKKADLEKLKVQKTARPEQIKDAEHKLQEETAKLAKQDAETVLLVAEKENIDAIDEAKKVSAANGQYGIRTTEINASYVRHPLDDYYEAAHKAAKG